LGYRRVRLTHAVSSDVQADTLDQHIKAAIELFPRYIPPIFEAITVEFFKKSNNYPHTYTVEISRHAQQSPSATVTEKNGYFLLTKKNRK
jgi:hypothetical protein